MLIKERVLKSIPFVFLSMIYLFTSNHKLPWSTRYEDFLSIIDTPNFNIKESNWGHQA